MEASLTPGNAAALFAAMVVLAAVPSVSVMTVVARSASRGLPAGAMAAAGIVAGDVVFILLAVFGLVLLVETLGEFFVIVKILGAVYLAWMGLSLWRLRPDGAAGPAGNGVGDTSSFMAGLLVTLADQKAILFYLGFLPAFMDLGSVTAVDTILLIVIATVAVGGVKLAYAAAADRVGRRMEGRMARRIDQVAALLLFAAAATLLWRIL